MAVLAEREVALAQDIEDVATTRHLGLKEQQRKVEAEIDVISDTIDEVNNALATADSDPTKFLEEFDLLRLQTSLDVMLGAQRELRPCQSAEMDLMLDINVYRSHFAFIQLHTIFVNYS